VPDITRSGLVKHLRSGLVKHLSASVVKLGKQLEEIEVEISESAKEIPKEEANLWKMKNNGYQRKSPQVEASPIKATAKSKLIETEFNCNECFFQGTSKTELSKHINLKHNRKERKTESTITCNNCGEQFSTKWNLMHHWKSRHLNTVAYCRNNIEGKCNYADDMCWWNHAEKQEENIECFICNQTFETKSHMMNHRKTEHERIVKSCSKFQLGNCRFKMNRVGSNMNLKKLIKALRMI
jgi:hypothetical protein